MEGQIIKNLIQVGTVSSVDESKCTARVAFGGRSDVVSYNLPVLVKSSLNNKDYWMPDPGEQVVCIFLPNGNAQGFILGAIYSDKDAPPVSSKNKRHITFADGTILEYDSSTHTLKIDAQGPINIVAAGQVNVSGDVVVTGGDVTADGISLKTHTHGGVTTGTGSTGPPEGGA